MPLSLYDSDVTPNHQQALTALRDSQAFGKYILNSALHQIHQVKKVAALAPTHYCITAFYQVQSKGACDGMFQCRKQEKMFRMLCSLGRPLFKRLETGGTGGHNQQGKEKVP